MKLESFLAELQKNAGLYSENMRNQNIADREMNYAEWHKEFTRWCEVGTEVEHLYYPPDEPDGPTPVFVPEKAQETSNIQHPTPNAQ